MMGYSYRNITDWVAFLFCWCSRVSTRLDASACSTSSIFPLLSALHLLIYMDARGASLICARCFCRLVTPPTQLLFRAAGQPRNAPRVQATSSYTCYSLEPLSTTSHALFPTLVPIFGTLPYLPAPFSYRSPLKMAWVPANAGIHPKAFVYCSKYTY